MKKCLRYKSFSHYILILFCILIFPPILWTINLMFMSIDCKATAKIIKHVSDCFRKTRHICQPEPVVKHQYFCEYLIIFDGFLLLNKFWEFFTSLHTSVHSLKEYHFLSTLFRCWSVGFNTWTDIHSHWCFHKCLLMVIPVYFTSF